MHDYKTIVVHVDGGPGQDSRVAVAARLCAQHNAHLVGSAAIGITWLDYALLTGSIGAPMPDPEADFRGLRDAANGRLNDFVLQAARLGIASAEARLVEDDARYALLLQSRYADLMVVSQDAAQAQGDSGPMLPPRVRRLPEYVV